MAEEMSKSAKKRAAQKARDASAAEAAAAEAAPPAPVVPEPKAKGKAKAAPKSAAAAPAPVAAPAEAQPKAKAKAKAKSEPAAAPPAAEAKAKAKGKAKAAAAAPAAPEPAPKAAAAPKSAAAAKSTPAAKSKNKNKNKEVLDDEVEEVVKPIKQDDLTPFEVDDGKGDAWEVCSGLTKKQQKQADRKKEEEEAVKAMGMQAGASQKTIAFNRGVVGAEFAPDPKKGKNGEKFVLASQLVTSKAVVPEVAVEKVADNSVSASVTVPEKKIGHIIGPKGATIALIKEKTGCTRIDCEGNIFTVSGPANSVAQAEAAINELVTKGFMSLAYDDFAENFVNVHPSVFPDLIGKQGCIIQAIKKELGCEISIPEVPKNADAMKKFKVGVAGKADQVEKTKQVINDIATYYHSEVTHPGMVHAELEVQEWQRGFIIGKGGCEMRHIQKNFNVKMYIPRENSLCKNVLVVGLTNDVERTKTYVEKVIWNAENASKGRDKAEGAEDHFGDEEPVEDWMRPYLFKR